MFAQSGLFALWGWIVAGSPGQVLNAFLLGVFLGVLRNLSGSLWAGIGLGTASMASAQFLASVGFGLTDGIPAPLTAAYMILPPVAVLAAVIARPHWFMDRPDPAALRDSATPASSGEGLTQKGILYDVGSSYAPGQSSREAWHPDVVRREIQVIRDELHCNAVTVFGGDLTRLEQCAEIALESGLSVWIQPRTIDSTPKEMLDQLAEAARMAERLRRRHPDLGLNIGCELTLFTSGCVPGRDFSQRTAVLQFLPLLPLYSWLLNRLLKRALAVTRTHFGGLVTYGAGTWEDVDWRGFDCVGLDYYWDVTSQANYLDALRSFYRYGKPVIVTEFGCCSYDGAELKGGGGAEIMDWSDLNDRKISGEYTRNEQVQADCIGSLIDVFESEGLHGAFVCMFIEGDQPYSPNPRYDLDMASYGVVRPYPADRGLPADEGHWQPKAAFHEIARRYGGRPWRRSAARGVMPCGPHSTSEPCDSPLSRVGDWSGGVCSVPLLGVRRITEWCSPMQDEGPHPDHRARPCGV